MEEKKKKTKKKTNTKKVTNDKNNEIKKATKTVEKKEVKKATKPVEKKEKEVIKVDTPNKETKEEILEKTYIFSKDEKENLDEVVTELNKEKIVVEKDVVTRKPANRNIIIVLLIAIVAIIILCIVYVMKTGLNDEEPSISTNIIDSDTSKKVTDPSDSSSVNIEYSNILNTNINKFEVNVAEGKDMLVLISSETCYFCVTFEPVLNEVLAEREDTVYRLNITNMSKEETNRLRAYYPFESAPILLVIRKGAVIADLKEALTKEELNTWYDENIANK